MRCVSVSQVAILALLGACAAVAWRMGDAKGINPALCAVAGFIFGPPFLLFLLWVPANSGAVPGVDRDPVDLDLALGRDQVGPPLRAERVLGRLAGLEVGA